MERKKVCVVGGGISGIVAAYTLMKKGHDVTVFERGREIIFDDNNNDKDYYDKNIGGKCFTKFMGNQAYELGACSCGPNFKTIIKFARLTGCKLRKRLKFKVIEGGEEKKFRTVYWPFSKTLTILKEVIIYSFHTLKFKILYDRKTTYKKLPEEYQLKFKDFCEIKNFKYITGWMDLPVTSFGYGEDIRTWYVFDYMNIINFLGMGILLILLNIPPVRRIDKGYGTLVNRIAEDIKVLKHTEVTKIVRDSNITVTVTDLTTKEERTDTFDDIVISIPVDEISNAMELTDAENEILEGITHNPYTIIAGTATSVPHECLLIKDNVHRNGHVALIEETMKAPDEDFSVFYIPETDDNISVEDTVNTLKKDLEDMGYEMGHIETFKKWHYFPHFNDSSFFQKIQAIQGKNNTYWVGAMTKFELAERAATQAEDLMKKEFEGHYPCEWFTTIRNLWYFYFESLPPNNR